MKRPLLVWLLATALSAGLYWLGHVVPWIDRNLMALIAVVFLYLPVWISWRREVDLAAFGFTLQPLRKNLVWGIAPPLLVFPLFLFGYYAFYTLACDPDAPAWLRLLVYKGRCVTFSGWEGMHPPDLFTWKFLEKVLTQVVVVALPEELFFRGYLHGELEKALPPRRRFLGGGIGKALILSSLLFALGHVLVDLDPLRLAVFFPGLLFGWMRSATGSITAGTIVHALSNLYITALDRTFFA